jgi:putative ABC transport system permease protein
LVDATASCPQAELGDLFDRIAMQTAVVAVCGFSLCLRRGFINGKKAHGEEKHSPRLPCLGEIGIDMRELLFTLVLSVFTGMIFGLAPALNASKTDLNTGLKETGAPGGSMSGPRQYIQIRSVLIGAEAALALILLVGAGLLTNSLLRLLTVNPGFNPKHALTMEITLPRSKYRSSQQVTEFFSELTERVKALPGVEAAGVTQFLPLSRGADYQGFSLRGGHAWSPSSAQGWYPREFYPVTPGYCQAMGVPLLEGRYLTEEDNESGTPGAVLISKTVASEFFPNHNPVGNKLFFSFDQGVLPFTIVGVVGDTKRSGFGDNQLWLSKPPIGSTYSPSEKFPVTTLQALGSPR